MLYELMNELMIFIVTLHEYSEIWGHSPLVLKERTKNKYKKTTKKINKNKIKKQEQTRPRGENGSRRRAGVR